MENTCVCPETTVPSRVGVPERTRYTTTSARLLLLTRTGTGCARGAPPGLGPHAATPAIIAPTASARTIVPRIVSSVDRVDARTGGRPEEPELSRAPPSHVLCVLPPDQHPGAEPAPPRARHSLNGTGQY